MVPVNVQSLLAQEGARTRERDRVSESKERTHMFGMLERRETGESERGRWGGW